MKCLYFENFDFQNIYLNDFSCLTKISCLDFEECSDLGNINNSLNFWKSRGNLKELCFDWLYIDIFNLLPINLETLELGLTKEIFFPEIAVYFSKLIHLKILKLGDGFFTDGFIQHLKNISLPSIHYLSFSPDVINFLCLEYNSQLLLQKIFPNLKGLSITGDDVALDFYSLQFILPQLLYLKVKRNIFFFIFD